MSETADDVIREALELPEDDRLRIASELLATVDVDFEKRDSDAWIAEVERRAQAAESGVPGVTWEDTRQQIEARLRRG